jgi:hypothetical protein
MSLRDKRLPQDGGTPAQKTLDKLKEFIHYRILTFDSSRKLRFLALDYTELLFLGQ